MYEFYLIVVILLFFLAITDLIVGVSNDAVNFLNSSIGSKVASRKVIMIVASLGILVGATFSNGMMEVARKGIFNPEFFFFAEIMIIFIAVMLTDIILLDLFNTFGMPTSTTVSIVFELLGAAVAVAILKIIKSEESLNTLGNYINSSGAILIISGIFISILIAFAIGGGVQFISRFLFSFHIQKNMKWFGAIWSGLALTALTYFLVFKGLKGASFISDDILSYLNRNTTILLSISIVFWSFLMQLCLSLFKINIFRIVVLFGTFALAMAFAGNDLVNFIGVPIAGLESFLAWKQSGIPPESFDMSILNDAIQTKTYLLVIAGGIMVTTLWFSKKARSVTETEVNLGRQDEGAERFNSNALSRSIVRHSITIGKVVEKLLPNSWKRKIEGSFSSKDVPTPEVLLEDPPAFDLVRASVNLTVASVLIAFATSLKLPLSTTYVSFMVAMGTSLADKAWGRSSAAYRVAGVINVIGGWFFTAFMAFTVAAVFATIIFFLGMYGLILLVALLVFMVSRTFILHKKKERIKAKSQSLKSQITQLSEDDVINRTKDQVTNSLSIIKQVYIDTIQGLLQEDQILLRKSKTNIQGLLQENEILYNQLYKLIQEIPEDSLQTGRAYILLFDLEQDILQSISLIVEKCSEYVSNSLDPIKVLHESSIIKIMTLVVNYLENLKQVIKKSDFKNLDSIKEEKKSILIILENKLTKQLKDISSKRSGIRESQLILGIILETKDLVAIAARFAKLYKRYYSGNNLQNRLLLPSNKEQQVFPESNY